MTKRPSGVRVPAPSLCCRVFTVGKGARGGPRSVRTSVAHIEILLHAVRTDFRGAETRRVKMNVLSSAVTQG